MEQGQRAQRPPSTHSLQFPRPLPSTGHRRSKFVRNPTSGRQCNPVKTATTHQPIGRVAADPMTVAVAVAVAAAVETMAGVGVSATRAGGIAVLLSGSGARPTTATAAEAEAGRQTAVVRQGVATAGVAVAGSDRADRVQQTAVMAVSVVHRSARTGQIADRPLTLAAGRVAVATVPRIVLAAARAMVANGPVGVHQTTRRPSVA